MKKIILLLLLFVSFEKAHGQSDSAVEPIMNFKITTDSTTEVTIFLKNTEKFAINDLTIKVRCWHDEKQVSIAPGFNDNLLTNLAAANGKAALEYCINKQRDVTDWAYITLHFQGILNGRKFDYLETGTLYFKKQ